MFSSATQGQGSAAEAASSRGGSLDCPKGSAKRRDGPLALWNERALHLSPGRVAYRLPGHASARVGHRRRRDCRTTLHGDDHAIRAIERLGRKEPSARGSTPRKSLEVPGGRPEAPASAW